MIRSKKAFKTAGMANMFTRQSTIRLLVMLSFVIGLTYGTTQIQRLPAGPRRILARFGRWLQIQADPVLANRPEGREAMDPFQDARLPSDKMPSAFGEPSQPGLDSTRTNPPSPAQDTHPGDAAQPAISRFELASQLQELGATHYRLEKWGDEGQLYRFQCEMAVDGQPGFRQHFEAIAPTDREAMRRVLSEVTANR